MNEFIPVIKSLKLARQVAIVLPSDLSMDGLCAALALQDVIDKFGSEQGKSTIFSSAKVLPSTPFLKPLPIVKNSFSKGDQLVIKISNRNAEPKEIKYEKDVNGLSIFVTAGSGLFKESDVSVLPNLSNFDLVVVLGATNLELLGPLYSNNTKLFFETPSINIDSNPSNEYFSKVNLVVPTASSLCEIIYDIAEELDKNHSEHIATSLLAGIISETNSFRDPKTTPATLLKAARLVASGARQQDIIQYLFKTKSLQQLQVWGRALARLTEYPDKQVITAVLTQSDIEKTNSTTDSFPGVLKDLIEMVTGYSLIVLIAENAEILIAGLPHENILGFAKSILPESINSKPINLIGKYEYITIPTTTPLTVLQEKIHEQIQVRKNMV